MGLVNQSCLLSKEHILATSVSGPNRTTIGTTRLVGTTTRISLEAQEQTLLETWGCQSFWKSNGITRATTRTTCGTKVVVGGSNGITVTGATRVIEQKTLEPGGPNLV